MKDKGNLSRSGIITRITLLASLTIIALFGIVTYNHKKNLNSLSDKMNNLISQMSSINDKYSEIEEKIERKPQKNEEEKYEASRTNEQKSLDKKIMVNCLLDIRDAMDISNKIPENCYMVFYLEDKDIRQKTDQLDFVTKESKSYKELGDLFTEVSRSIEKELFKRKLLKWKTPRFFAEYLPNVVTWRKMAIVEPDDDILESSLIKGEKYLKEKNIELATRELKNFESIAMVGDWMKSALIYQKNSDLLKEILEKILEKKQ